MSALAEGPRHVLLGERAGWHVAAARGVEVGDRGLRLRRRLAEAHPLADAAGGFGGLALPTGVAVDRDGDVYVLDAGAGAIKRYDSCERRFLTLPCVGGPGAEPRRLRDPQGLAVSPRGDLYVADTGNRRVQVFSRKGLALRAVWGPFRLVGDDVEWVALGDESTSLWRPWDVAIGTGCAVLVADYDNGVVHVFGARGDSHELWPSAGERLERPTHLAVDDGGQVYVVQEGRDHVVVLDERGRVVGQVRAPDDVEGRFRPVAVGVDADDTLYIGERHTGCLHLFEGEQREYAGPCVSGVSAPRALAFDRAGNVLLADGRPRVLELERDGGFEPEGTVHVGPLDSGRFRCEWHRVLLHADVPEGAAVRVETLTSEARKAADEVTALPDERWSRPHVNAQTVRSDWDCLVQSPPGRYLWLRLTLHGGASTPEVQKVKVFFPRASSLRFLPAVYSEDPESREFTARFLSIFDTIRESISLRLDGIAAYFHPGATPAASPPDGPGDFLGWLASWLGLPLDRSLPEERRRELLRNAHDLYRRRGTPEGLRRHVALYTSRTPLVLEHFKLRRWLFAESARLGDTSTVWGDAIVQRLQLDRFSRIGDFQLLDTGDPLRDPFHRFAHGFTVFVPAAGSDDATARARIERVVALAKPAHTEATVELVEPRFRIGTHSFIGLDTVVADYPRAVVEGESRLGYDTVLGPSEDEAEPPTMRIGVRARIGSTTVID